MKQLKGYSSPSIADQDSSQLDLMCSQDLIVRDHLSLSSREVTHGLSDPNRSDFESQIASDFNPNPKNHCDYKTPLTLPFHCDFCGKSLRLRNCDWQSLAICDCNGVGH